MSRKDEFKNRRRYLRLDSVFPVQFRMMNQDGKGFLSEWLQGFTNNISRGGICLSINSLNPDLAQYLKNKQVKLLLEMEMPILKVPIPATVSISWVEEVSKGTNKYFVGLKYEEIDDDQNDRIMRYAWTRRFFFPVMMSLIVLLVAGVTLNGIINMKLVKGNKALVDQLVKILQDSSVAKQKIKEIARDRQELQLKIQAAETRIYSLEDEKLNRDQEKNGSMVRIEHLNALIDKIAQEKATLQEQMVSIQNKENTITEDLLRLDRKKASLERANIDKMYRWLKVHQNPRTGLVISFEGDNELEDWAFLYDQALALQAFTNCADFDRVKKMLDFFSTKAKRVDGRFVNAYYANDGTPAEFIVHVGPNVWLGLAIVQYTVKTQDRNYLGLAEQIAQATMYLQNEDSDGGLRGGPSVEWYSTEHNLDAYAFFNMLYQVTDKEEYKEARDKVLHWLINFAYGKGDVPIMRGKGDATIATDTYAWSIAAIGPEKLFEVGMNPDKIMEFAEKNCSVEVKYYRPEGKSVTVKGFDFAPQRHSSRGGVVSPEWTAQMILSYRIMADYYFKKGAIAKARAYELKGDIYLAEMGNMIISSPSPSGQGESCLPYASMDNVDTGHGWKTPKGQNTGSVAGTAYTIFAYDKYNPLELKE